MDPRAPAAADAAKAAAKQRAGPCPAPCRQRYSLRSLHLFCLSLCRRHGAGMGLAICSDIIVASTNAVFGLPEIDIGLMGGVRHTMRVFPVGLTRRMVLTGYRVPAEELYRRGLIEACVAPEALMPTAMDMARSMASKSPTAIRLAKRALNTVETMGLKDGYRFEQNLTVEMTHHPDSKEAMAAFLEKRPAVFGDDA